MRVYVYEITASKVDTVKVGTFIIDYSDEPYERGEPRGWTLYNDGTVTEWERSNNRFRAGNRIMAETCHVWFGWFRPAQRMLFRQSGELLYRVVSSQVIGWPIWAGSRTQGV